MFSASTAPPNSPVEIQAYFEVREGGELKKKIEITQRRVTIGRREYCDLVLAHATVSGEHCVIHLQKGEIIIRDLNSRNGTLVNGQPVSQQGLAHGDEIDLGVYRLRLFVQNRGLAASEVPVSFKKASLVSTEPEGLVLELNRPITSVGIQGQQVAVVAKRRNGFFITHVEGLTYPTVNGESIGLAAFPLEHDDTVILDGITYKFQLQS
jgi:hypothetical protein